MSLTGIQIFKYLPAAKKLPQGNCKACGCPTCMAFALKLAQKQVEINVCEHIPCELLELFEAHSKKQQHTVVYGKANPVTIGGETVMFRHEKTFVNKTSIAIKLESDDKNFDAKLKRIAGYCIERVGEQFKVDAIYLIDKGNLLEAAKKVNDLGLALIINTKAENVSDELLSYNPIFEFTDVATCHCKNPLVATLSTVTCNEKLQTNENTVLNLDIKNKSLTTVIEELTQIRRMAMINRDETFAHPVMTKIDVTDKYNALAIASFLLCRYSNLIVFSDFDEALLTTLFTLRQGIYTDPQKPLQVEAKVYELNEPDENALVLLTTNFALTYFAVANELESTSIPAYLIVTPSDGMSVLTAWSADKFNTDIAVKAIANANLRNKVKHNAIIIPGLLSDMHEELQEALPDWKIVVGPNEAYQLPDFINKK